LLNLFCFRSVGGAPNPTLNSSIRGFIAKVKQEGRKGRKAFGKATDGDADRFGTVDPDGTVITADQVMGILTYDIGKRLIAKAEKEGIKDPDLTVIRTVVTSSFVDAVAAHLGIHVIETKIGFKYIVEQVLAKRKEGKTTVILGGEGSAHLAMEDMLSWDDGILMGWYLAGVAADIKACNAST
jgi:phosphomannomutase